MVNRRRFKVEQIIIATKEGKNMNELHMREGNEYEKVAQSSGELEHE